MQSYRDAKGADFVELQPAQQVKRVQTATMLGVKSSDLDCVGGEELNT